MKKILLGSVFIIGGIWLVKKLSKNNSDLEKPKLKYIEKEPLSFTVNGQTIILDKSKLEETYQHVLTIKNNIRNNTHTISDRDFRRSLENMTPEQAENLKFSLDSAFQKGLDLGNEYASSK